MSLFKLNLTNNEYSPEYIEESIVLNILMLFTLMIYIVFLTIHTLLGYEPLYSNKGLSRAHSSIHMQENFAILLICITKCTIQSNYLLMIYSGLSIVFIYSYHYYLPYYSTTLNFIASFT